MPTKTPSKARLPQPQAAAPAARRRKTRPRSRGRPEQDGAVGQEAIIRAARVLLRECAPQALLLKDVAALAGIDAALIHYYFGNKDGLVRATIADMMAELQARSRMLLEHDWSPEKRVRERLATIMQQQLDEPNFHRLVVDQLIARDNDDTREVIETITSRGMSLESDLLKQSGGKLRRVDPRFLNIYLQGLCAFFATARPLVEIMFGRPVDQKLIDAYIDFSADVMLNGLLIKDGDKTA